MNITSLNMSFKKRLVFVVASLLGGVSLTIIDGSFVSEGFFHVSLFSVTYTSALVYSYLGAKKFEHYTKNQKKFSIKSALTLWCIAAMLFALPAFLNEQPTGIFSSKPLISTNPDKI